MSELRLCVVYADDDDLVRETVANLLIDAGVDVYACASGPEAIALCEQIEPDAVLLDLNMPGIDGLETARRIRGHPNVGATRLVAITGRGTWDVRNKAMDAGFNEFLTKPVPTETLVLALRAKSRNVGSRHQ